MTFMLKASTPMSVYLPQGAQSGEDCGRQRGYLVESKAKPPVGRREERVRLTLFRHRSAFACVRACVRACQCVSAVQVRAYLKKHPRKSNGNGYANARNTHLKLRAFIRSAHMVQKRIELTYSQKHTSIQM